MPALAEICKQALYFHYDSDIESAIPITEDGEVRIQLNSDMAADVIYISLDELEEMVSKLKGDV